MKPLIILILLLNSLYCVAQPFIGTNHASQLIDDALKSKDLKWLPFPMPYSIVRADKGKDARFLSALSDHKLLMRKKETRMATVEENGKRKRKVLVSWIYDYPASDGESLTDEGFYYGYGRLKNILELSKPYLIGDYYYVEAYIQWYVDDMQEWIKDSAFDDARTLRRSRESFLRPFEKRVFLQYDGNSWAFWEGKPGEL
ncbi:MAG: hypothetical protein MK185_06970 [Saccharospirillaceae bacterium]|nr:hypothetical protein A3759_11940 [Thalassolituus sp. HI0120]KZZ48520.1 hypothetical protein A3759_27875 [Thalassolituus sp. HI0120]MCH2040358.1 hypothetical protein [Saccharospirillaceae bacterium]